MKILILPSTTYEALVFAQALKKQGHHVIGAASVSSEFDSEEFFSELIKLPHLTDDSFLSEFEATIRQKEVSHFWTSVNSIYAFTQGMLATLAVELLCFDPMETPALPVKVIANEMERRTPYRKQLINTLKPKETYTSPEQTNSLILNALSLPGQSYLDKLLTVAYLFPTIPEGDLVEIGSLWGRSAMLFASLSNQYNKGNLLCIDPWSAEGHTQGVHKALDDYSANLDISDCFNYFVAKLSSLFATRLNYLREFSDDAIEQYKSLSAPLLTREFGSVCFEKKIALLHIDGNHGYEAIKSDVEKWCPLVVSGGWIIFDDYNWSYGEGPKVVVDNYLEKNKASIEFAFFCGGALFAKLY